MKSKQAAGGKIDVDVRNQHMKKESNQGMTKSKWQNEKGLQMQIVEKQVRKGV